VQIPEEKLKKQDLDLYNKIVQLNTNLDVEEKNSKKKNLHQITKV